MSSPNQPSSVKDIENRFRPLAADISALVDALNNPTTTDLCTILRSLRKYHDLIKQFNPTVKMLRHLFLELYIACMRFLSIVHPLSVPTSKPCGCSPNDTSESQLVPHGSYNTRLRIVEIITGMVLDVVMAVPQYEGNTLGQGTVLWWPRSIDDIAPLGATKLLLSIERWATVLPPRPAADLLECYQRLVSFTRENFEPPITSSPTIYRTFLAVARQPLDAFKTLRLGTTTPSPEACAQIGGSAWAFAAMAQLVFQSAWNRRNIPSKNHYLLYCIGREYVAMLQTSHFYSKSIIAPYPHVQTWVHVISFLSTIFIHLELPYLDPAISAECSAVETLPDNSFEACHGVVTWISILTNFPICCSPTCETFLNNDEGALPEPEECEGCRMYRYCSRECQVNGWKEHKTICKSLGRIAAADTDRLFLRLLFMPLDAAGRLVAGRYITRGMDDFILVDKFKKEHLDPFTRLR